MSAPRLFGISLNGWVRDAGVLTLIQLAQYLLPVLVLPFAARKLGVEALGTFATASALAAYLGVAVDFGFNVSGVPMATAHRGEPEALERIYASVAGSKALLLAGAAAVLIAFGWLGLGGLPWSVLSICLLGAVSQAMTPLWLFQAHLDLAQAASRLLLLRILGVLAVFAFVRNQEHLFRFAAFIQAPTLLGLFWLEIEARRRYAMRWILPEWPGVWRAMKLSTPYFFSRMGAALSAGSSTATLGIVAGPQMAGLFSVGEKVNLAIQGLFHPVCQALYPHMAIKKDVRAFRHALVIATALVLALALPVFVGAETFLSIAFGAEFQRGAGVLRVLLGAVVLTVPSQLLGYPFLGALGRASWVNGSTLLGAAIQVIGLLGLHACGHLTPLNAAFLVFASEGSVFFLRFAVGARLLFLGYGPGTEVDGTASASPHPR